MTKKPFETMDEPMANESPQSQAEPGMTPGREMCVPVAALAMPDESETMEPPAVGDAVQFNCEGKVSRIEGEYAFVKLSAVNGQQVPETESESEDANEPSEEEEMADLEEEAKKQPDRYA